MSSNIKRFLIFLSAAYFLTLLSCSNDSLQVKEDSKEYGYISLGKTSYARSSVVPQSNDALLSKLVNVNLECSRTGDSSPINISGEDWDDFLSKFTSPGQTYPLQTGSYSFTLTATLKQFEDSSGVAFNKTITETITTSTTTPLNFTLVPETVTTGGIKITWNITANDSILEQVNFSLKKLPDGTTTPSSVDDFSSGKVVYQKDSLEPGEYELTADFRALEDDFNDPELPPLSTWKGNVRVVAGITTIATINWALEPVYTITWNPNGGTIDGAYVQPLRYTRKSDTITLPDETEITPPTGYDFAGWYGTDDFSDSVMTSIPKGSAGAKPLYAKYTKKQFTVSFDTNGGGTVSPQTVEYNNSASEPATAPTKTKYYFTGWHTSTDGGTTLSASPFDFTSPITENITLYARFINTLYVKDGGASDADGTYLSAAFDSIASAVSKIVTIADSSIDWNIAISGIVSGVQTVASTLTSSEANSITITGASGVGVLDAGGIAPSSEDTNRSTLTVTTTIPVTITNLEITGGRGTSSRGVINGGGLFLGSNAKVSLGSGVKIYGNTADYGGGAQVGAGAVLCMFGDAVIGDTEKSYIGSITTASGFSTISTSVSSESYSNWKCANFATGGGSAAGGGGIANYGTVALGYSSYTDSETNTPAELTGGIYNNCSYSGGGIINSNNNSTKLIISSGNISYNAAYSNSSGSGAAIYNNAGAIITLKGGSISNNYAVDCAGGVWLAGSNNVFNMEGGEIKNNHSFNNDGTAVYVRGGTFNMTNGTISGNKVHMSDYDNEKSAAIYLTGATVSITGGTITNNVNKNGAVTCALYGVSYTSLTIGGSAEIANDGGVANAFYVSSTVTVSSSVTNNFGIMRWSEPTTDTEILTGGNSSTYSKFTLLMDPNTGWTVVWGIDTSTGKAKMQ